MVTPIASFLQGGGQPSVPGVAQVGYPLVSGVNLQPTGTNIQGSSATVQGTAPTPQGSSPKLQVTANPFLLPSNATIKTSSPVTAAPSAVPSAPAPAAPPATAPAVVDKSNDISQNLSALDATKAMLSGGLGSIKGALASLLGRYDTEASANQSNYDDQSVTNKGNFLKNEQSALVNAAQGRQGLMGVLASLGALNGSGVTLANSAVQKGANDDISGANDTFATNQSALDTGIGSFKTADQQRREDAAKAEADAEKSLQSQVAQNQQSIYGNLSNDYADMGNSGQAKTYSDLLASLFPSIAANSVPSSGPAYSAASYTPASLSSYLSGGTTVNATPAAGAAGLPGLMAYVAPSKKKEI